MHTRRDNCLKPCKYCAWVPLIRTEPMHIGRQMVASATVPPSIQRPFSMPNASSGGTVRLHNLLKH